MEALAVCEGTKSDEFVQLEKLDDKSVVLRWDDRSIPQSFRLDAKKLRPDPIPASPETWVSNSSRLLAALNDAMKIVPTDGARYALNCVQLRPEGGRLAATDGHQLLIEHGFEFPWRNSAFGNSSYASPNPRSSAAMNVAPTSGPCWPTVPC